MDASSVSRLLATLATTGEGTPDARLCSTCVESLRVDGASVAVFADASAWGALCSSDALATTLLDLQDTLGEGPTLDAYHATAPVSEVALGQSEDPRWVAFSAQAHAAGAAAVFAYPLQIGAACVGVLTLHRRRPGPLTRAEQADALVWAEAVTHLVLAVQANGPPSVLAAPLEAVANYHAEVHQAAGILAVRLGVSVGEALVRLRAHAYAEERPLVDVARAVVAGRLRLE